MNKSEIPVVLIHGFTGCAGVWTDIKASLGTGYDCIAIELPGHGRNSSVTDPGVFTFEGVVDSIAHELTEMCLPRFNLWGYSLGGRVSLQFALKFPERVHRLILESSSPGLKDTAERNARLHSDEELAGRIESAGLESFVDYWMNSSLFASQKLLAPERQSRGRQLRLNGTEKGYAAALRGFSVGRQEPLYNRLRELMMPSLVIVGELDPKYRAFGETMAHSIPNAQFRIIPGAGHAPHWERPVETADVVAAFIGEG